MAMLIMLNSFRRNVLQPEQMCIRDRSWLALAVASYSANEDHAEKRAGYRQALRLLILDVYKRQD